MRRMVSRWLFAFCIVTSNGLLAQPFFFRKDIPIGVNPFGVVVGDFNGDGRPDLAFSSWEGTIVLLNTGGGNFGKPIRVEAAGFYALAAGDFNGDGKDDLVGSQGVLLSRGDGTFLPLLPFPDNRGCYHVAIGNFNGDGKPDLVCQVSSDGWVAGYRVLIGNGDGTFGWGAALSTGSGGLVTVLVADFNRDGRSDVVTLWPAPPPAATAVVVFLGQGDGTFAGIQTLIKDNIIPAGLFFVADFNGDGVPDLATAAGVMLGKGNGSFQPPVAYPPGWAPLRGLIAADFTGDGKADLVVARSGANLISVYPGKGDGTFLPPTEQAVGWLPHSAVAVDLDGDGRLDLVIANFAGSNTASILLAKAQGGPALRRAVSAASDTAVVAPESLASLFAPTTATVSASAPLPWPTRLGGMSLEVRDSAGATRLAPLLFVSPTQINFQVPAGTALGEATLAIVSDSGTTPAGGMQVDGVAPGLFMVSPGRLIPAATGVLVEAGGTQVPVPLFTCAPSATGISCEPSPIPLSTAGDRPIYLSFFGTGFRGANPDNVTCSISGVRVPVLYAGPQGTPGLDQINIRLLPYEVLENDGYEVILSIDGVAANTAFLALR